MEDILVKRNRIKKKANTNTIPIRKYQPTAQKSSTIEKSSSSEKKYPLDLSSRRKLDIRIPDYEDPLCMPVRAFNSDSADVKRLRAWNNLCLKHYKHQDVPFRPDNIEAVSSSRTVVLRNLFNKMTGRFETTLWSKVTVEDKKGIKKSEIVQSVLPKYREKQTLNNLVLLPKRNKPVYVRDEVLLTKEQSQDEDSLLVYKLDSALALLYKTFSVPGLEEDSIKNYMREVAVTKMCSYCYQTSSRGHVDKKTIKLSCSLCGRACLSVYNLLAHLRGHDDQLVRRHIRDISRILAQAVEYHYKCRICQQQQGSIRSLRKHIQDNHTTSTMFRCEVGNHVTS